MMTDCEEPLIELGEDFACGTCVHRWAWQKLNGGWDYTCGKQDGLYEGLNVENIRECAGARKELQAGRIECRRTAGPHVAA